MTAAFVPLMASLSLWLTAGSLWEEWRISRSPLRTAARRPGSAHNAMVVITIMTGGCLILHALQWLLYWRATRSAEYYRLSPTAWRVMIGGCYCIGLVLGAIFFPLW